MFSKFFSPILLFNLILIVSFSISINYLVNLENINILFYIFFHITFIYFLFYHYHYSMYLLGLFYGVFLDIFLINSIGSHLLCLILLISLYVTMKKYLFLLSSFHISATIFIILIITLYLDLSPKSPKV